MIYKASSENVAQLLSLPETGMGFQIISAHYKSEYVQHSFLILNSSIIIELNTNDREPLQNKILIGYAKSLPFLLTKELVDIQPQKDIKHLLLADGDILDRNKGAIDNPVELIANEFPFIRL